MYYESLISEFVFLLHKNNHDILRERLDFLLQSLSSSRLVDKMLYLKTLFLLIAHVRDIYFGHGMRDVSYMMVLTWYRYYPVLAIYAVHQFFMGSVFGSWNDIKYFAKYLYKHDCEDHPLLDILVSLANRQLKKDYNVLLNAGDSGIYSNVSKWIPREKKLPEFFKKCVADWFSRPGIFSREKKSYRNIVTKMSGLANYNFRYFHGNMFAGDYVRAAIFDFDSLEILDSIEIKWKRLCGSFVCCKHIIPVVDTSIHISDSDFFHSIGLAILVATMSQSYRIMFVSHTPIWIEFDSKDSFVSVVWKIWSFAQFRSQANFDIAIMLLRDGVVRGGSSDCRFVIFSQDFDFDLSGFDSCVVVLWNIGFNTRLNAVGSLGPFLRSNIILFSGASPALLSYFSCNADFSKGSFGFLKHYLFDSPYGRYDSLSQYFDGITSSGFSSSFSSGTADGSSGTGTADGAGSSFSSGTADGADGTGAGGTSGRGTTA